MKTFSTLSNLYGSLSQNSSAANIALGKQLMNDRQRYLLQKYFDNERSFQTTTVGGQSLTTTASLATNDTSATLTAVWAYPTGTQLVNFSNADQRSVLFTNGSATITWVGGLTSTATTAITSVGQQAYAIPAVISKITNDTISVGQLKFVAAPVMSRNEWDRLNTLPYTSQITNYFYIYNGNVEFFPIPSSTGNIIQFNYKGRVPDMSFADVSDGHLAAGGMVSNSTAITGLATAWTSTDGFPLGVDISYYNLYLRADPPYGDGIWYPISKFNSDTSLTLALPIVNAPNITASTTYTIGQMPVLFEDFHDMLVDFALQVYFSTIVKDKDKATMFGGFYAQKELAMERYLSNKQTNVDLGGPILQSNPNLYPQSMS